MKNDLEKHQIVDEIISNNWYMLEAFKKNDKQEIVKRHLMVQELIESYLDRTKNEL